MRTSAGFFGLDLTRGDALGRHRLQAVLAERQRRA
jgi:hypothetical protein